MKSSHIVITGASSGFGEAISLACAREGANVILGARRMDRLERLSHRIQENYGTSATYHSLDVTDARSVQTFAEYVLAKAGHVDVLVNNAGLGLGRDLIKDAKDQDWTTMFETNVMGVMRLTQAFLRPMESRGNGHIVNIGSIAGHEPYEGGAGYCGTKFALRALTKTLRQETFGKNIRVTSIDPGMAETEFSIVRFGGDAKKAQSVYEGMVPLSAQDVAEAVVFSISRPAHVNIDEIILTPTAQVSATRVFRKS